MRLLLFIMLLTTISINAQHHFSGNIDHTQWQDNVYLSLVEDYRKVDGIYPEQIIAKVKADSTGYFKFIGNQLETDHRIYKIHVDNCFEAEQNRNHFGGHCNNSKSILFIAKNTDTINFPFSFDSEMFCNITSNNTKTAAFINIDALKNDMSFDFASFRSEANRKLNNKKWFDKLQDYGHHLNEPLAELYIYEFLSNRSSQLYTYYLEDLKNNTYYDALSQRLENTYPDTNYAKQYKSELASDKFILNGNTTNTPNYWLILVIVISILLNVWFWLSRKKSTPKKTKTIKEQLTKQEQKIVDLLLEEKTNKEIAAALFISLSTVKTHINNIYKKLNIQSREEIKTLFNK